MSPNGSRRSRTAVVIPSRDDRPVGVRQGAGRGQQTGEREGDDLIAGGGELGRRAERRLPVLDHVGDQRARGGGTAARTACHLVHRLGRLDEDRVGAGVGEGACPR